MEIKEVEDPILKQVAGLHVSLQCDLSGRRREGGSEEEDCIAYLSKEFEGFCKCLCEVSNFLGLDGFECLLELPNVFKIGLGKTRY